MAIILIGLGFWLVGCLFGLSFDKEQHSTAWAICVSVTLLAVAVLVAATEILAVLKC